MGLLLFVCWLVGLFVCWLVRWLVGLFVCLFVCLFVFFCKSGKQHKTCSNALCTMDDASYFLVIRLGPKTSECEKNVTVVSTVTGCDVTNCATTSHGFNKQLSKKIKML